MLSPIAFRMSSCSNYLHQNLLGVFNIMSQSAADDHTAEMNMSSSPAASYDSDLMSTTGYLEDVLFQFSSNKRRRLVMMPDDDDYRSSQLIHTSIKRCWESEDLIQNFDTLSEITKCDRNSDMKTPEEAVSETYYDSSSYQKESADNYQWTPEKENLYCIDPIFSSGTDEKRKKILLDKVVYPFDLVKPGGFEGDMTLNDINERMLMPPTRPVRHPVGDFACRPMVSPNGPGLSGKAVVAFTRIHTQGRGTITIVRTRG